MTKIPQTIPMRNEVIAARIAELESAEAAGDVANLNGWVCTAARAHADTRYRWQELLPGEMLYLDGGEIERRKLASSSSLWIKRNGFRGVWKIHTLVWRDRGIACAMRIDGAERWPKLLQVPEGRPDRHTDEAIAKRWRQARRKKPVVPHPVDRLGELRIRSEGADQEAVREFNADMRAHLHPVEPMEITEADREFDRRYGFVTPEPRPAVDLAAKYPLGKKPLGERSGPARHWSGIDPNWGIPEDDEAEPGDN